MALGRDDPSLALFVVFGVLWGSGPVCVVLLCSEAQ